MFWRERHERSRIWRRSMRLVRAVYRFTERFPADEKSNLTGSMRKTVVGLPSAIAEGFAADDEQKLVAKLDRCREGIRELQTYLALSRRLKYGGAWSRMRMGWRLRGAAAELMAEAGRWREAGEDEATGESVGLTGQCGDGATGGTDAARAWRGTANHGAIRRLRFRYLTGAA